MKYKLVVSLLLSPIYMFAQQAHVNVDWNPHKNTENLAPPYGTNTISPEVKDNQTVTFRLLAPDALNVAIVGLPGGTHELVKGENGLWQKTIGPFETDIYIYRLRIDGVTVPDPNNTLAGTADQPPYSLLIVHGKAPNFYDIKAVPHGSVTRNFYHSEVTNGEREMYVYTPPGYDGSKKYPVLYLTGGSGEIASNWAIEGRANFIMDNLLAEGKVVPMIIAMPNNQMIHRQHPNHINLTFDLFEKDLKENIVPFVDAHYSTIAHKHGRALSGLSMGGRHAMVIGFKNLDIFGSIGVLSAGDMDAETNLAGFLNDPTTNSKIDYLFVGQGSKEAAQNGGGRTMALHKALENHGIKHEYYDQNGGAHEWKTWRHLLYAKLLPGLWR